MKKHSILFACAVLLAAAAIISACSKDDDSNPGLPTDGLVAHYPFDGDTKNKADNQPPNSNGFNSGATFTTDRKGQNGNAIHFNGVNSYVEIAHHEAFNFGKTDDFTISFWVKPAPVQTHLAPQGNKGNTIIAKWPNNGNTGHPFRFRFYNQGSPFFGDIVNSRWTGSCQDDAAVTSSGTTTADGAFHHIVFIKEGNQITFYQDNKFREMKPDIPAASACDPRNNAPILIGVKATDGQDAFLGDFDDLRIYNRALSKAEIELLYKE